MRYKGQLLAVALSALAGGAFASDGKTIYSQTCAACHSTGLGGAPKLNEKQRWEQRLAAGRAALIAAVVKGKGGMPPKAGNPSLSEGEIRAAVDYMVVQINGAAP